MAKSNLILIGMPGAGKSTIGVLLAKALGRNFLDTDVAIQADRKKTLQELIEEHGLAAFCRIEQEYIQNLDPQRAVIATGGSAVYYEPAMRHLRSEGIILYLQVPLDILKERVVDTAGRGVVMEPGQTLETLYEKRVPLYEKYADLIVDLNGLSHQQAVEKILNILPEQITGSDTFLV